MGTSLFTARTNSTTHSPFLLSSCLREWKLDLYCSGKKNLWSYSLDSPSLILYLQSSNKSFRSAFKTYANQLLDTTLLKSHLHPFMDDCNSFLMILLIPLLLLQKTAFPGFLSTEAIEVFFYYSYVEIIIESQEVAKLVQRGFLYTSFSFSHGYILYNCSKIPKPGMTLLQCVYYVLGHFIMCRFV